MAQFRGAVSDRLQLNSLFGVPYIKMPALNGTMHQEEMPKYLLVAAAGEFEPGLAVGIRFGMKSKNGFFLIVFIYDKALTLSQEDLLTEFDQVRNVFVMDYADPRVAFDGNIQSDVLTETEIRAAIKAYHQYANVLKFSPGYLQNLEKALEINPRSDCIVAFDTLY